MKVEKILFPVDLSETSPKIAPYVRFFSSQFGGKVHVLFVARAFEHYAGVGVPLPYIGDFSDELKKQGENRLREFMDEHFHETGYTSSVISGDPGESIVDYAQSSGADLIIMGTHGRKGLERVIFGSVAEYVVKNSPTPVLTLNPFKTEEQA